MTYLLGEQRSGTDVIVLLVVLLGVHLDGEGVQDFGHLLDGVELDVHHGTDNLGYAADHLLLGGSALEANSCK